MKRLETFLFVALLPGLFFRVAASELHEDQLLAEVNGKPVTLSEVCQRTGLLEDRLRVENPADDVLRKKIWKLRDDCVEQMIDEILLIEEFERLKLTISPDRIEKKIDEFAELNNCHSREKLQRKLAESPDGLTLEELRRKAARSLMLLEVLARDSAVIGDTTPRELYECFRENIGSGEKKITLTVMKLPADTPDYQAEAARISESLRLNPEKFAKEFVRLNPGGAESLNGNEILLSQLRPEFGITAANAAELVGKIVGPVELDGGTMWLKVVAFSHEEKKFGDVELEIRTALLQKRRHDMIEKLRTRLRANALIVKYVVDGSNNGAAQK